MTTTTSTSRRSSSNDRAAITVALAGGSELHVTCSTRLDGDFHRVEVPYPELERRRRALVDLPWTQLDEHHGVTVVRVDAPGAADGEPGDVAITDIEGAVLGCWVGDCAPVVLVGAISEFAVVHAGWRGLAAGVIQTAIRAFHEPVAMALLGPAIGPCCYEFGASDLGAVAAGVGDRVGQISGRTRSGQLALDVQAAVTAACRNEGVPVDVIEGCTGCSFPGYSHRVRRDPQRHVVAAWRSSHPAGIRSRAARSAEMGS
jgi:copper oxidase (laccase) domain-containing protein